MGTVRPSSKGQFVLPKTELVVLERVSEVVIKAASPFATTRLEPPDTPSVYNSKPLTIEDMDLAIAVEAGKRR